ncbi:unnamed protein product, partial [Brenthis ino]
MLKLKFSKFKQVYALTFLPRLFLKESRCVKNKINNCPVEQICSVRKSTNSKTKDENSTQTYDQNETLFSKNEIKITAKDDLLNGNIIFPEFYQIPRCTKCESVISKLFGTKKHVAENIANKNINAQTAKVHATTATIEEEKLVQKVDVINETPHVEAHPPKIEGFNSIPKILGQDTSNFEASDKKKVTPDQKIILDELAKRCLDSPVGDIDNILLNELKNISQTKSRISLSERRSECVEKYFDQIFEKPPKHPLVSENLNYDKVTPCYYKNNLTECKVEKLQPVHLATLPHFTIDGGKRDFKETGFIRSSSIYLTANIKEPSMDIPSQLSPYDQQAIPFYEYTNKEHILEEDAELEAAVFTETIQETEFNNPIPEETIRKDALDQEQRTIEDVDTEEPLNPKPTVNYFYEPLLQTNFEGTNYVYRNFTPDHISNILSTQQLLTTSDQSSGEWRSEEMSSKGELHNSAISGTYTQNQSQRRRHANLELPTDTAISANQNPGEYYDWKVPVQFSPSHARNDAPRVIVENTVSQNVLLEHIGLEISKESPKVREGVSDINTYEKATENMEELANPKEISDSKNNVPLSVLLKRIREQSRIQYCQHIAKAEAEVVKSNKSNCPPPPDKKPMKAGPCKPIAKPKSTKKPSPCPCPEKKDPCAKFFPFFLNMVIKSDVSFDLSVPLQYKNITSNNTKILTPTLAVLTEDIIEWFKKLGNTLNISGFYNMNSTCTYARDFEPWIPIPSLQIPKLDKKKPFVCPKDSCKSLTTQKTFKDKQCPIVKEKKLCPTMSNLIQPFINCLGGVAASMYGCTPGGPGFESRVGPSLVIESFCIVSLRAWNWEVGGVSPPCLGEHVKPSVLRLNFHWSCRVVIPLEYESDRNRECTLCLRVHLCTVISPAQLASLNEIGRRDRNRSGEHQSHPD